MESKTSAQQTPRYWHLDLLRILAILMVVLHHAIPTNAELDIAVQSATWRVMNTLFGLCVWDVPVMFMISGALMLSENRRLDTRRLYRKNIARLVVSFCFWSAVYALAFCMVRGKGKWTFLNQFLRGHYHMWFLLSIIPLYVLTPLLRRITASRRATEYLLLIGLLFSFVPNRLLAFLSLFELPHADVFQSVQASFVSLTPYRSLYCAYYYVLGHYLQETAWEKRGKWLPAAAGAAALAVMIWLSDWQSGRMGETSPHFYAVDSLGVLVLSSAIFLLFKRAFGQAEPGGRVRTWILRLSSCSFGIYLIHPFLIERMSVNYPLTAPAMAACILGLTVVVYVLSCLITAGIRRIPILKKMIV